MKKILICGIGFVAQPTITLLQQEGYEVEIYSRSFGQDILDRELLDQAIQRNDAVLLMAAIADLNVFEAKPLYGMQVNIVGVINVANSCAKHHKRLYFISTCCCYGNTPDLPSNEESIINPSEIYACAKAGAEWIVKGYNKSYDMEYVNLRIATVYGPEMRSALVPAIFLGQALSGEPLTIHGDGKQTRTLTYIDDIVEGVVAVIKSGIINETVNISSEEERSVLYLAETVKKVTGSNVPIKFIEDRKGQTHRELIDASKAYRLCGWKAKYSLEDGIKATYEWMQKIWKEQEKYA